MKRWVAIPLFAPLLGCPPTNEAVVSAPRVDTGKARIAAESVSLRCSGVPGEAIDCDMDARYELDHAGGPAQMSVYGTRAHAAIDAGESATDSAGSPADPEDTALADRDSWTAPKMLSPIAGADAEHVPRVVQVRTSLHPDLPSDWDPGMAAPRVRHYLMSRWLGYHDCQFDDGGCHYRVGYATARIDERSDEHAVDFRVEVPEGWRAQSEEVAPQAPQDSDVGPSISGPLIETAIGTGQLSFTPGGPFVALGAFVAAVPHFKARVGYELFAPHWLAHALALEVDAHDERVTLVPTSELVSGGWLILPSVGAGLGVPIQVSPNVEAGARLLVSLHWPLFGVVATLDAYPSRSEWLSPSLYLEFGL